MLVALMTVTVRIWCQRHSENFHENVGQGYLIMEYKHINGVNFF